MLDLALIAIFFDDLLVMGPEVLEIEYLRAQIPQEESWAGRLVFGNASLQGIENRFGITSSVLQ